MRLPDSGGTCEGARPSFAGHLLDDEPWLLDMGARSHQAQHARFLSVDPIPGTLERPATWNAYTYALNNPLGWFDPEGLQARRVEAPNEDESEDPSAESGQLRVNAGPMAVGASLKRMGQGFKQWRDARAAARGATDGVRQVTFTSAHGARHLEGTGLTSEAVESVIKTHVQVATRGTRDIGSFWGRVTVNGQTRDIRAVTL